MKQLSSTTLRTALVDYRAELLHMGAKYPDQFKNSAQVIAEIDDVLLSIEGNITTVSVSPCTCNPDV